MSDARPSTAVVAAHDIGLVGGPVDGTTDGPRTDGRHLPGEVGTWMFIFGDMLAFAMLFGIFMHYRSADPELFRTSQLTLTKAYGAINTLLLLTSSLMVVTAVRALRQGHRRVPRLLLAGAIVCGIGFSAVKAVEWGGLLADGHKPASNDFYMVYFMLTGIHFVHLVLGMLALAAMIFLAKRPVLSTTQTALFEGAACFWHMVDLLWMVIFALLFLVHT